MSGIALTAMNRHKSLAPSSRDSRDQLEEELSDTEDVDDAEHSLLNNRRVMDHEERGKRSFEVTPHGRWRAYWLGLVVCIGGFLCRERESHAVKNAY